MTTIKQNERINKEVYYNKMHHQSYLSSRKTIVNTIDISNYREKLKHYIISIVYGTEFLTKNTKEDIYLIIHFLFL